MSDLAHRSLRSVWHPCTPLRCDDFEPPLPIVKASGPWLYDAFGRRYFDAISSWWVNLFGHADPLINAALKEQLDTLPHVMLAGCTHESAVLLAEKLAARTQGFLGHAFYGSDGASAVEIALKMSFHFWNNTAHRDKLEFICLHNSYHGETVGALSVTDVALFRDVYDPLLMKAHCIAAPDSRKCSTEQARAEQVALALAQLRSKLVSRSKHIAALIIEPLVQCAAGMIMFDPSYLRGVYELCQEFGVHLIADEIAVGMGRTGSFFAFEQATNPGQALVWPDFLLLSKGITAGYLPLSVVLTRNGIYESFKQASVARSFLHSHSYSGNALACRAALATLERFEQIDVFTQNASQSACIGALWQAALAQHPRVAHLRQCGMIWAFDVLTDDPHFARRFHQTGLAQGLLIRPIGRTVYVMPPYLLLCEQYAWLAEQTLATLEAVLNAT